jgi:hypothetical protein
MTKTHQYAIIFVMRRNPCSYHFISQVLILFYQVVLPWTGLFQQLKKKVIQRLA